MSEQLPFTMRRIERLPAPSKRETYRDSVVHGLQLRMTPSGTKTFSLYTRVCGNPERITLGRFPELTVDAARKLARQKQAAIAAGDNPAQRRERRSELTLDELHQRYITDHIKPNGFRVKQPTDYYNWFLSPWGTHRLSHITNSMVRRLHAELGRNKGKVTANRTLALLRAMYNRALDWGEFGDDNPTARIKKFREPSRDRFVQPDELPKLFNALAEEPIAMWRDWFLLALLTGARKGNICSMRWEDINFATAIWRIPTTKNKDPHCVPLVPQALGILKQRRNLVDQAAADGSIADQALKWVFFSVRSKSGHIEDAKAAWDRILRRADLWSKDRDKRLCIHDLRRTMGSWQAGTGASLPVIQRSLGHRNIASTMVYARLNIDPVRDAMNKATAAMFTAAGKRQPAEVLPVTKKSA